MHVSHVQRLLFLYDGEFSVDNGVSNYIRTIGNFAAQEGCRVDYLVGESSVDEPNVISISRTTSVHANGSRSAVPIHTSRRRAAEVLEQLDPDAVHVQLPYVPFMSGKVLKALKKDVPLVGTFHTPTASGWLGMVNKLNAHLTKPEMRRFDHFYSVSEASQRAAEKIYGVKSDIMPCPINLDEIKPGTQASKVDSNSTTITFLGRLVARKGLDVFVDSLLELDPESSNLHVQIIGDGEERGTAERKFTESHLKDKVEFLGKVDNRLKYNLLANSDIVVCPSNGGESFGIVLVEAMAAGRPVVLGSDISGYSEVLQQVPAALVSKDDPYAFARRIEAVIENPNEREAIFKAQQEVVRQFDISQSIGPRLMQAYGFSELAEQVRTS